MKTEPTSLEQANNAFIFYPRLKDLHRDIQDCKAMSRMAGEAQCMALEGVTGAGKTTLSLRYAAAFPRRVTAEGTAIPVFYMETPSPATVKIMASAMLEQLGDPLAHYGTIGLLNSRLIRLLMACQVELVILDDFHHLIDTETDRVLAKVSDWLKVLIKETGIPFLVVGIEGKVERVLQANAQLSRLFAARETLAPFGWDMAQVETVQAFNQFVLTVEESFGKPLTHRIKRPELLFRLFYATDGVVGNIMNLMRYAVLMAQARDEKRIELDTLGEAFEKRLNKHLRDKVNPFLTPPQTAFAVPERKPDTASLSSGKKQTKMLGQVLAA